MPIYEYQCPACQHEFEALIRNSADTPRKCPACGSRKLVKGFSAFAVAARDPSPSCQTCPTASATCGGGSCSAGGCPYSG